LQEHGKTSYIKGAAILTATSIFVKIIGAIYKIPLFQEGVLGKEGTGDFQITYSVYSLILTIATAGIPAALSRLVSTAKAKGDAALVKRYFKIAMPAFFLIGFTAMLAMFFFADGLASLMSNSKAATGIKVLAPAVLFACIMSVYRGWAQGFQDMVPTAMSQIVEVLSKAVFGLLVALWFVSLGYESHIVSAGAIVGVTIGLGLCIPLLSWRKQKLDKRLTPNIANQPDSPIVNDSSGLAAGSAGKGQILAQIMKVSIPITLTASFMSIMVVIDNAIVMSRLQGDAYLAETARSLGTADAVLIAEQTLSQARGWFGQYSRALTVYNLTPALLVPISVSIIPAIAAARAIAQSKEARAIMHSSLKLVNLIAMPAAAGLMVLAKPIMEALYNDSQPLSINLLFVLGPASFFVCMQYITTSILQANGHEKVALLTFPIGAAIKIALTWFLAGNPYFGILASPMATFACFMAISALNILFILSKVKDIREKLLRVFLGPALCACIMASVALVSDRLLSQIASGIFGGGRAEISLFLAFSVFIGIAVYTALIVITRTVTKDDMKLIPKGEKLAKYLRPAK